MTFTVSPRERAEDAAHSLRMLARETRVLEHPSDSYEVMGELLGGVRSLQQVVNQLARQHRDLQLTVRSDAGNALAGRTAAVTAMDKLRQAAGLLEMVEIRLDQASQASGRIVWPAEPSPGLARDVAVPQRSLATFPSTDHESSFAEMRPIVELGR
jgi:hypothetical protein